MSIAPSAIHRRKVVFKNSGRYAQADPEAVAQLHAHGKVSHQAVQDAAQRLIDTGYFDDVGATLGRSGRSHQRPLHLQPLTPEQMTVVGFENFVWLTPDERDEIVRKALPLFQGRLPAAGNQPDAVTTALQNALIAKGIKVNVVHDELEPSLTQPNRAISFRVDQSSVQIHALSLRGVSPALVREVKALAPQVAQCTVQRRRGPGRQQRICCSRPTSMLDMLKRSWKTFIAPSLQH